MRNYFYLLPAFTLIPICSFSQIFGGQLKSAKAGTIGSLNCSTATNNGTLTAGTTASNISSVVSYTGGNGASYNGQTINSTGVIGLSAVLTAGSFVNGSGTLTYIITGIPASSGTASFALSLGGQSCTLTRAVANSSSGCGNQSTVTDIDGNVYPIVEIGTQCWMKENLKVSKYRNGEQIPTNLSNTAWQAATTGAHAIYNNDAANNTTFGKLYNWYAVVDSRNLCPTGWHVPSDVEWMTLENYLGGSSVAGGKLKSTSSIWTAPNTGATNESFFSGLPGGSRSFTGTYLNIGNYGHWWSSTNNAASSAWLLDLKFNGGDSYRGILGKRAGFSVRCLRDAAETSIINNLDCIGAVNTGTLTEGIVAASVSSSVPYTGGNGGTYMAQTITSTGVSGLTATLAAGTLLSGAGSVTYTITGTPASSGTASFALSLGGQTCTLIRIVGLPVGTITALSCSTATNNGTLTQGVSAASVSSSVPYTGGNGGTYSAQTITSTGVTGLTATLAAGTLLSGAGSVIYNITGTPATSGTANFALSIGGQSCTFSRTVASLVFNPNLTYGTMSDIDGNTYKTIVIGTQTWMAENLKTTKYRNGDPIPTNLTNAAWSSTIIGAYSIYNDDAINNTTYGKLYNWYAVADSRNLCPVGWHVPSDGEWTTLGNYLGGSSLAGAKLKSTSTLWNTPNSEATNESGFAGIPGGLRGPSGGYSTYISITGDWWSTTLSTLTNIWIRRLSYDSGVLTRYTPPGSPNKSYGFSVRCLRD